jgi:hypothetical protein
MSENMLGGALREACGPLKDLMEKLAGKEGLWWLNALKKFLRKENPFTVNENHFELREMWKKIYKKHFRMKVDFSNLHIPEKPEGDWWLIIVAKDMSPEKIFLACKKAFGAWKWTDQNLDKIIESIRSANEGSYAIWVRANVEADEEFKNLSANQLKELGHNGVTLEERGLLEIMYFEQTGNHLDIQCITLCTGSRYGGGSVLLVDWYDGKMDVRWYRPASAHDYLRSRQVVS